MRLLAIVAIFFCLQATAHSLSLGANCGAGASVDGSKNAGKITIGADPVGCTVNFSWPKTPSCSAMLERNTDPLFPRDPSPLGTISTATTLFISDTSNNVPSLIAGDVVSYLCVGQ